MQGLRKALCSSRGEFDTAESSFSYYALNARSTYLSQNAERHFDREHSELLAEGGSRPESPQLFARDSASPDAGLAATERRLQAAFRDAGFGSFPSRFHFEHSTNPRSPQHSNLPPVSPPSAPSHPVNNSHLCIDPELLALTSLSKGRPLTLRQRARYGMLYTA